MNAVGSTKQDPHIPATCGLARWPQSPRVVPPSPGRPWDVTVIMELSARRPGRSHDCHMLKKLPSSVRFPHGVAPAPVAS